MINEFKYLLTYKVEMSNDPCDVSGKSVTGLFRTLEAVAAKASEIARSASASASTSTSTSTSASASASPASGGPTIAIISGSQGAISQEITAPNSKEELARKIAMLKPPTHYIGTPLYKEWYDKYIVLTETLISDKTYEEIKPDADLYTKIFNSVNRDARIPKESPPEYLADPALVTAYKNVEEKYNNAIAWKFKEDATAITGSELEDAKKAPKDYNSAVSEYNKLNQGKVGRFFGAPPKINKLKNEIETEAKESPREIPKLENLKAKTETYDNLVALLTKVKEKQSAMKTIESNETSTIEQIFNARKDYRNELVKYKALFPLVLNLKGKIRYLVGKHVGGTRRRRQNQHKRTTVRIRRSR